MLDRLLMELRSELQEIFWKCLLDIIVIAFTDPESMNRAVFSGIGK